MSWFYIIAFIYSAFVAVFPSFMRHVLSNMLPQIFNQMEMQPP